MLDLAAFLDFFFDQAWEFYKIPFPFFNMTCGQVGVSAFIAYFGIRLFKFLLNVKDDHNGNS